MSAVTKRYAKVKLLDNSQKTFVIQEETTASELKYALIQKIMSQDQPDIDVWIFFSLFEKKGEWERCLDPDEKPLSLMLQWNSEQQCDFIFKKKIFIEDTEKSVSGEMQCPETKYLIYAQALSSVISSEYPCTMDDAIKLAALQAVITYGKKTATYNTGFLAKQINNFVPRDLLKAKKDSEWETAIYKVWSLHVGTTSDDAQSEYLSIVKSWPYYGTTFYPPLKVTSKTVGNRKIPSKLIIGINSDGILLLKSNKELFSTHAYTEICTWASSTTSFGFEYGSINQSQKYSFSTQEGPIIASTVQTYVDILIDIINNEDIQE